MTGRHGRDRHERDGDRRTGRRPASVVTVLAVAGIAVVLLVQSARPHYPQPEPRMDGLPLRAWAASVVDSTAPGAGLSFTVKPVIRPLDERRLDRLRESEGYRMFLHRCSSCHNPPDPSMHSPHDWRRVVQRMAGWMEKAGTLPMPAAESLAIIPFLEQAVPITR